MRSTSAAQLWAGWAPTLGQVSVEKRDPEIQTATQQL
jgi:hypothetical protein